MKTSFETLYPDETTQLKFFELYKKISNKTGAFYMGYIFEDIVNNYRSSFTTNLDWGKEYVENYIEKCHLWNKVSKDVFIN